MPNKFKIARANGTEELAYSFEDEAACLSVPAASGLFIIEKGDDIPNGWKVAYIGIGAVGAGQWQKVTQAETHPTASPIVNQDGDPVA